MVLRSATVTQRSNTRNYDRNDALVLTEVGRNELGITSSAS